MLLPAAGAFLVQVVGQAAVGRVPGKGLGLGPNSDLRIPEGGGQAGVYAVDLQRQPAGQLIAAAFLVDQAC